VIVNLGLDDLLTKTLRDVSCSDFTREYIRSVFSKPEPIKSSITLSFLEAKTQANFSSFQKIGDWSLFCLTLDLLPQHSAILENLGCKSYEACYFLLKKQWDVFGELAENMPKIADQAKLAMTVQLYSH
jgi:hypothetical protein